MKKIIALIFGGASTEHTISCKSVMSFINNIDCEKYDPILIGITKDGAWYEYFGDPSNIPTGEWVKSDSKREIFISFGKENGIFYLKNGEKKPLKVDVFVPVLHGKNGEDGTIQGLFEMLGARYVGCGVSASANSMDKATTKLIVSHTSAKQADYELIDRYNADVETIARRAIKRMGFPLFIKPCASGSSIGICKAKNESELISGIKNALLHDSRVLIEEFINARELECAVLETNNGIIAEVGEVISADEFYDFDSKYNNSASITTIEPDVSPKIIEEIKSQAIEIFKILNCRGLSRIDFFLNKDNGEIIFNEINTLPGFTNISMFPMLVGKDGYVGKKLIDELIESAL